MARTVNLILIALAVALVAPRVAASSDAQLWQGVTLKWFDHKPVNLESLVYWRFTNDLSQLGLRRVGQTVNVAINPWLNGAVTYRYTESKTTAGTWRQQHRGELELTPRFKVNDKLTVSVRNRFEVLGTEGVSGTTERTRHRIQASWRGSKDGLVAATYISNETFYDIDRERISENRLVPLGLRLRVRGTEGLNVQYIFRANRTAASWTYIHAIETVIGFKVGK